MEKVIQQWQQNWDTVTKGRHLQSVQSRVNRLRSRGNKRKEQVTISRITIGHSNLNGTLHIMGKHPTGLCDYCREQ